MQHAIDSPASAAAASFAAQPRPWCSAPTDLALAPDPARPLSSVDALLAEGLRDAQGRAPLPAQLAGWSTAERLDALLRLCLARGLSRRRLALRCTAAADCGADFHAELDLAACQQASAEPASLLSFQLGSQQWQARMPTGADQARWSEQAPTPAELAAELLQPAPSEPPAAELIRALDQALAQHDPLRLLRLELSCPECGAAQVQEIQLEAQLLAALAERHREWLAEIATLARAFHWSEAELAALPGWRRRFYLQELARAAA